MENLRRRLGISTMGDRPGWNPCKPYAEDAPVVVKRHAKVTNDAKLYLPPS